MVKDRQTDPSASSVSLTRGTHQTQHGQQLGRQLGQRDTDGTASNSPAVVSLVHWDSSLSPCSLLFQERQNGEGGGVERQEMGLIT